MSAVSESDCEDLNIDNKDMSNINHTSDDGGIDDSNQEVSSTNSLLPLNQSKNKSELSDFPDAASEIDIVLRILEEENDDNTSLLSDLPDTVLSNSSEVVKGFCISFINFKKDFNKDQRKIEQRTKQLMTKASKNFPSLIEKVHILGQIINIIFLKYEKRRTNQIFHDDFHISESIMLIYNEIENHRKEFKKFVEQLTHCLTCCPSFYVRDRAIKNSPQKEIMKDLSNLFMKIKIDYKNCRAGIIQEALYVADDGLNALGLLNAGVEHLEKVFNKIKSNQNIQSLDEGFLSCFPMKSLTSINVTEDRIKNDDDFRTNVTIFIIKIGGSNVKNFVKRVLQRFFTIELSSQCSWTGFRNNIRIENLIIMSMIKGVCCELFKTSDKEFETHIKHWFRHGAIHFARDLKSHK